MGNVKSVKRYSLVLPDVLFDELQVLAKAKGVTVLEVLRQFIKLGLLVVQIEGNPDASFLIRDEKGERELTFVW